MIEDITDGDEDTTTPAEKLEYCMVMRNSKSAKTTRSY